MDEADLCVVCNKPGRNFHEKGRRLRKIQRDIDFQPPPRKPPPPVPVRKSSRLKQTVFTDPSESSLLDDLSDHQLLQAQLRVIFLLQEVFKHPVQDPTTLEAFQIVGNPSKWFEICEECSTLVDTGIEALRKLKKYEKEHKRINAILKRKLSDSATNALQSVVDIKSYSKKGNLQDQDPEVSRVRVEFRNKIRKTEASTVFNNNVEIDIKQEPGLPDSGNLTLRNYENDYPTFDADFEDAALSPEAIEAPPPSAPKEPSKKRRIEEGENTWRGRAKYSKRTSKAIQKSKKKIRKKTPKPRKTLTSHRVQQVHQLEKPPRERKRIKYVVKADEDEEDIPDKDDGKEDDPDFSVSEDEEDEEEIKWQEKHLQQSKPESEKPPKVNRNFSWFYEKCSEYLDMSLFDYSPEVTENDKIIDANGVERYKKPFRFPCPSCDKTFSNKFFTIAHIHRFHLGVDKPWRCNMCSHKSQLSRKFQLHILDHNKGILKTCEICHSYSTRKQKTYDFHVINHQRSAPTPTCHICKNRFTTFKQFVKHVTEQHKLMYSQKYIDKESVCELCSKVLRSQKRLKYHLLKEHNVGDHDGTFPMCPECGEIFFGPEGVSHHQRMKHPSDDTKCFCEHCGKEFNAPSTLKSHIERVHIEEPQNCRLCGMEMKNARRLEGHMKTAHKEAKTMSLEEMEEYARKKNEEMAYHCRQCSERFAFSVQLFHHYRSSHPEVTDKFKCDICGKGFSRQSSVKRHVETNHMKVMVRCEYCGKEFKNGDSLGQHRRYHCAAKRRKESEQARLTSGELKHEGINFAESRDQQIQLEDPLTQPVMPFAFIPQTFQYK